MTPAEWDALEAARTNWHEVGAKTDPLNNWAVIDAQQRLISALMNHVDELVAGVRPKCPGCEGDGTQMYQRGWVQKPCHECGGSGFASDRPRCQGCQGHGMKYGPTGTGRSYDWLVCSDCDGSGRAP